MEQKTLAKWLKIIISGVGFCGVIVVGLIIPMFGKDLVESAPEFEHLFFPWIVLLFAVMIPVYVALAFAWEIASNIGRDKSFSNDNARYLKIISYLIAADTAVFFIMNVVYFIMEMSHPGVFLFSLLIDFAGVCITVCAAALSHLTMKSAVLQKQIDLTI